MFAANHACYQSLWVTWDHYPIFARVQEEPHIKVKWKKWTGWNPTTKDQLLYCRKEVMQYVGN